MARIVEGGSYRIRRWVLVETPAWAESLRMAREDLEALDQAEWRVAQDRLPPCTTPMDFR